MAYTSRRAPSYVQVAGAYAIGGGTYLRKLLGGACSCIPTSTGRPGISGKCGKCRKCRNYRHFAGGILRMAGAFLMPILPVFTMFPLRGRAFHGGGFRVFAAGNGAYLFMDTARWRVSKVRKVPEFAPFWGVIIRVRGFHKANFTCFTMLPLMVRPSAEGISVRLRLKTVLTYGNS